MHFEPLSQNSKQILDTLRGLIEKENTVHLKKNDDGWQYGGLGFNETVESLRQGVQEELANQGFHVVGCTVRHFVRGANILNRLYPTKRILMIPMNGTAELSRNGPLPLPPDTYCYIEDQPTLYGENIDVIFVGFETENKNN